MIRLFAGTITCLFISSAAQAKSLDLGTALDYKYSKSGKIHWFKVCPDQTCNIFRAPLATSKESLTMFIIIHDCLGWGYSYPKFQMFCEKNKEEIQKLVEKSASKDCSAKATEQKGKCVLRKMANENSISIQSEITDEGKTCRTSYHLDDVLERSIKLRHPVESDCQ